VPGGIGCERAADDPELVRFLQRMEHSARFVAASSTGTIVLASAGLLHGRAAATHWLASDLLRRYGSDTDGRHMVVAGNVITCEGSMSAVDASFALVERLDGTDEADRIRATLLAGGEVHLPPPTRLARLVARLRNRSGRPGAPPDPRSDAPPDVSPDAPPRSPSRPTTTPLSVMVELVDDEELAR
jgi:transcriptional regulator GlxA family with amidase domain